MKKFLTTAAFAALAFTAAPAFAEETVTHEGTHEAAPVAADPAAAAKEECTKTVAETIKLSDTATDEEKAQFEAAVAECLKGKGVSEEVSHDPEAEDDKAAQ